MCNRILNDHALQFLRMGDRQPETDRTTIVLHIQSVLLQADRLRERSDDGRKVIECIPEPGAVGRIAMAEAGIVRGDEMIVVRQLVENCVCFILCQ